MVGAVALELAAAAFDAVAIGAWLTGWNALIGSRLAGQPNSGQRHSGQSEPESPESLPPRDRLSHRFRQLIEFVIHNFLLYCLLFRHANEHTQGNLAQHMGEVVTALSLGCHRNVFWGVSAAVESHPRNLSH